MTSPGNCLYRIACVPKENNNGKGFRLHEKNGDSGGGDGGGEGKLEDFRNGAALRCPDLLIGEFKTAEKSVQFPPS